MEQYDLLTVEQAARVVGVSVSTLNKLRTNGGGPAFLKATRHVRYRLADLQEWLAAARVGSTAEYALRRRA